MFLIVLTLTASKTEAAKHMEGHRAWIRQGIANGQFVMVGSLGGGRGGGVLVQQRDRSAVETIVAADPFVEHGVAQAQIIALNSTSWALEYDESTAQVCWSTSVDEAVR